MNGSSDTKKITIVNKQAWLLLSRGVTAFFFVSSAYSHIIDPFLFGQRIADYELLPWRVVVLIAMLLPLVLLILAAQILLDSTPIVAFGISAGLSFVFLCIQLYAIVSNKDIACGCFGGSERIGPVSLMIALSCLVAATVGCTLSALNKRETKS